MARKKKPETEVIIPPDPENKTPSLKKDYVQYAKDHPDELMPFDYDFREQSTYEAIEELKKEIPPECLTKPTGLQIRFIEEYCKDLNGTQAAIRAGYAEASAKDASYRNLNLPHIAYRIKKRLAEKAERTGVTNDRIIAELAKLAFFNIDNVIGKRLNELCIEDLACVSELQRVFNNDGQIAEKVKFYDKHAALLTLSKISNILSDNREADTKIVLNIKRHDKTVKTLDSPQNSSNTGNHDAGNGSNLDDLD